MVAIISFGSHVSTVNVLTSSPVFGSRQFSQIAAKAKGQRKPLADVWSDDLARIIGPYREHIEAAFTAARDPDMLADIEVIFFLEDEKSWGVRFTGAPLAVHYATDLVGPMAGIKPRPHWADSSSGRTASIR
jgi:hypothetical protein